MSKRASLFDALLQPWSPCTGSWTVVDYLRYSSFPTSYRPLCAQWESLGRPRLRCLSSTSDLEEMATKEETISVGASASMHSRSREDFAVFFHNYCSFSAQLEAIATRQQQLYDQKASYESHQLTLFAALESDRSACQRQGKHDCLKTRLWGEFILYYQRLKGALFTLPFSTRLSLYAQQHTTLAIYQFTSLLAVASN